VGAGASFTLNKVGFDMDKSGARMGRAVSALAKKSGSKSVQKVATKETVKHLTKGATNALAGKMAGDAIQNTSVNAAKKSSTAYAPSPSYSTYGYGTAHTTSTSPATYYK
jgi:hypothetical protein